MAKPSDRWRPRWDRGSALIVPVTLCAAGVGMLLTGREHVSPVGYSLTIVGSLFIAERIAGFCVEQRAERKRGAKRGEPTTEREDKA